MAPQSSRAKRGLVGDLAVGIGTALGIGLAAIGTWIAYSLTRIDHEVPLPEAITAHRFLLTSPRAGQLNYYLSREGQGRPLVLIHSINAAASAYEMKPLFETFRGQRSVFALELPGFGFSDRSARKYTPELYEAAILDFLEGVVAEPADVVALSLGAEFAARAALSQPERFHSLAMISPTGMESEPEERLEKGDSQGEEANLAYRLFTVPLWARPFYDLLTTRASIRYFLDRSFVRPVPEEMIDYAYATAHQPGAENAPFYFVSGQLFTEGVRPAVYERLEIPVLVIYDEDAFTGFNYLPELIDNYPNWKAARIQPTLGLPQFEKTDETAAALQSFWNGLEENSIARNAEIS
ncbi:MAG TPA: alpha/beta fold hydrolase [Anaerolineaceae bacterium]|nr:alpha/beta fold hydrolase [Anaerolineaceae bacterium]